MQKILHIVCRDEKFTACYINFLAMYLKEYMHVFTTMANGKKLNLIDGVNIHYIRKYWDLLQDKALKDEMGSCDKIIVTGVFGGIREILCCESAEILGKTYLHFWGGDFYCFRKGSGKGVKEKAADLKYECMMKYLVRRCAGIIHLIDTDREEFQHLFPYDCKYFVAPMPIDPLKEINYDSYRKEQAKEKKVYRILVGNSADRANCHLEAFEKIKRFVNEKVEIVVPLSYGDEVYRENVIEKGTEIFGDKFKPITRFMDIGEYTRFLNGCDIAIFNNNRQQAMGNINSLLLLGKKVYLRSDNRMWEHYKKSGTILYDFETVGGLSLKDLVYINPDVALNNIKIMEKRRDRRRVAKQWEKVFEDNKTI